MKKIYALLSALVLAISLGAQTLNVTVGNVTYQFPAAQTGEMTYADGTTLTIMGKTFAISDITGMTIDEAEVADSTVSIVYGASPTVTVAGNVAKYVDVVVTGTQVSVVQTNSDTDNDGEITYLLSGSSEGAYADGLFYLAGSYKSTVELNDVTLANTAGPAVCINNGKRIDISCKKGTVNTLTGLGTKTYKGCLYIKGHSEFKGKGTLNVNCSDYHGVKSNEYMTLRNCTLNVAMTGSSSNLKDGIHVSEYFLMESGSVSVTGISTSDDAIQVELDGTISTGELTDHDGEDSGNVYIEGGTLTATAVATATKCVRADGDIRVTGGTLVLNAQGDMDASDLTDISYTAGFKAGGNFTLAGGETTITVTGAAGRGIGADGTFTSTGGQVKITNSGATKSSGSSYFSTAKGIKASTVDIQGGDITVTTSGAASKGIKADGGNMTISGGTVNVTTTGSGAYDGTEGDAKGCGGLKADGNITINGGTLTLKATGTGGKCIKADGTLSIGDGTISATSTGSQYRYSSNLTASPKAIKSNGALTISGGEIVASSSNHEGIESKSTLTVTGGYVYSYAGDDAINSAGDFTISGGYVMGNSSGNDGLDANGNFYIKGGTVFAVATREPEVGIDANTEQQKQLYITGGNVVAIGGLENGTSISNGTASQTSSYSKGTWYALYNGSNSLAVAFKVPSNNSMGTSMVVYTTGTTSLLSGVTGSGTSFWNGYGYSNCSGGSSVTLSTYTGGNGGPGGGGGPVGPGGGGRWW
jgi:hypothetical protein